MFTRNMNVSSSPMSAWNFSGEKIQWYLAAELRDRIRQTSVKITVIDRLSRKQYAVEPRQYEGRLLHQLPAVRTPFGDVYAELYLNEPSDANGIALFRHGTRVIEETGNPFTDHTAAIPGLTGTAARTAAEAFRRGTNAVSAARSFLDDLRGDRR